MLSKRLNRLVYLLSRLPGVGEKTAQRYALFLLTASPELAGELGTEIATLHEKVKFCTRCGHLADLPEFTEHDSEILCDICLDHERDPRLLCVVARVHDLMAMERSRTMKGRYFVLGKLLSPLDGILPSDLPLQKLRELVVSEGVEELILATPPSVDGEATALLIKRELTDLPLTLSRIASGVPHGGDLEFADPITLGRALDYRQKL